jgi:peptide/nickel transport system substrate-binding protein
VRFRRAVSHAIDRQTLASVTLQGLATPLYGFISPGNRTWAAKDLPRTDYDLEKARTLLKEAGFVLRGAELFDAKGNRVELTLIVPVESQPRTQMATVVQEDLAKLGIKLQLAPIEFGELTRRVSQSFDYDAALLGTSPSEPDPSAYANVLRSSSPFNQWHPKQAKPATAWEARIDELIALQGRESNLEKRRALFQEIQQILAEQLPVIPIVSRHLASASNQRIGNHRPSTMLPYSLWNAEELFVR